MAVELATDLHTSVAAELLSDYRDRTARSRAVHEAARRVLPGGDTRTIAFHPPYPLTILEGHGSRITDADGQTYLDFLNNYTSLIHGHGHRAVTEAVTAQLPRGTAFPASHPAQARLAEIMTERVASVDLIRFCNSGTEAVMNAIRAARAFTGRDLIVKMEGGYHGTYDDVEVSVHPDPDDPAAGIPGAPIGVVGAAGVPANTTANVLVAPFNDIDAIDRILAERGDEIAAVIVEPVMGAGGMIPADELFLETLRARTVERGCLLIFDEVMSFRLECGGMQERYRIRPDLTTFAKIIGGGFPIGAFGGRAAIMEQFDPAKRSALSQSGTFNGNVISMIDGIAAMELYLRDDVARINGLGDRLRKGFTGVLQDANVHGTITGYGSFVGVHLTDQPVRDYRGAARVGSSVQRLLHLALLLEGIFCAPRLAWSTSTAMSEKEIDVAVQAFSRAIARVRPALTA